MNYLDSFKLKKYLTPASTLNKANISYNNGVRTIDTSHLIGELNPMYLKDDDSYYAGMLPEFTISANMSDKSRFQLKLNYDHYKLNLANQKLQQQLNEFSNHVSNTMNNYGLIIGNGILDTASTINPAIGTVTSLSLIGVDYMNLNPNANKNARNFAIKTGTKMLLNKIPVGKYLNRVYSTYAKSQEPLNTLSKIFNNINS